MPDQPNRVSVADIDMPFLSMVRFMVKWAIAAIPAFLILLILGGVFGGMVLGFFTGLGTRLANRPVAARPPAVGTLVTSPADAKKSVDVSPNARAAALYIPNVLVRQVEVGRNTLGEPGVFGEVKNTGDSTLKEVEITVFCLGPDGKPVFEKQYHPVLVTEFGFGDSNQPLKPGYVRKFGVKLDDAPAEWTKKVEVKVTAVEFLTP